MYGIYVCYVEVYCVVWFIIIGVFVEEYLLFCVVDLYE